MVVAGWLRSREGFSHSHMVCLFRYAPGMGGSDRWRAAFGLGGGCAISFSEEVRDRLVIEISGI
jgi:hypothetical protein